MGEVNSASFKSLKTTGIPTFLSMNSTGEVCCREVETTDEKRDSCFRVWVKGLSDVPLYSSTREKGQFFIPLSFHEYICFCGAFERKKTKIKKICIYFYKSKLFLRMQPREILRTIILCVHPFSLFSECKYMQMYLLCFK